jgi:DNA-binding SARP family transcriptional activator
MRFRVLGPMQVWHGDGWTTIRAAQPRIVLAVLLTQTGQVVSADRLVDELWGEHPPRTALNTIQGYVARLRKLLGDEPETRLLTRDRGYLLEIADGSLDSHVFERLVESGQRSVAAGELADGVDKLVKALALWRGPALHDVPPSPVVAAEANRLEQRRLTALEARLGAELALGRHVETVDELQRLVAEYPLREQLRCHLMLAMYRCGRRAEALDVYRSGRAVLVAELGMEPGPELRKLERAILADDRTLFGGATTARVTPAQIPAGVAGFTGRQTLLRQLDGLLPAPGTSVIITIAGTPGVGKTALAVHWAHRVRDRFGDGQLYVNLHGYAAGEPVRPIDALARFLHALGVPAEQVPTDVEEAAALYRSALASRRMLVLLDNAHHPDQVRPLLPGAPGSLVLVTSRDALTGLVARDGARGLRLDVLTPDEANALLTYLLGADRVKAETKAVAELAKLCAYLPLALRITAANLGEHTVSEYCDLLRAGNRLAALQVAGDEQAAVQAAFDLSYAALPEDARRLFRLLGLVPGADVTVEAAAALSGTDFSTADRLLTRLAAAHLVDRHPGTRYGCHDLLRLYASERSEQEDTESERDDAVRRLYDWYLHTVDAAATLLYPQARRLTLPPVDSAESPGTAFTDTSQALAWLDAERQNLVAAVRARPLPVVGLLADALRGYFWMRMYTVDWLAVANAGLAAAEACEDLTAQTGALLSLADANFRLGHYQQAIDFSARALDTARQADWSDGEAAALNNLGNLYTSSGRLRDAVEFHRTALALNHRIGRLPNQIGNLENMGIAYRHLGDLHSALARHGDALEISRKIGSVNTEAINLSSLGSVLHDLGQYGEALDHLRPALAMHREVGDRVSEVETGNELAAVLRDSGEYDAALEQAQAVLTLAREAEFRHGEADALNTLGTIHLRLGHLGAAIDHHQQSLALARDTAHRYGEARALIGLAAAKEDEAAARQAIELTIKLGYRVLEGQARTVLAVVHLATEELDEADELATQALTTHRETGYRLGEAEALLVLGGVADRTGDPDRAVARRREATSLLADIGAAGPDTAHSPGRGLGWTSAGSVPRSYRGGGE